MPQGQQQLLLPDRLLRPLLPAAQPLAVSSHLWGLRLLATALPVPTAACPPLALHSSLHREDAHR